ncbi:MULTISPECIES: nucleobase:cation symporter-2 family protein [Clostridium]|uniref:Purine permease n=2 Tax=Clostridium TaxID=1485 RepID=A0A3M0SLX4_9CLOT|nr:MULTISPECIES: nucleobase:cation symporter-2 family protein [Clostridium]ADK14577.1 putative xanthine/uracil permease [Clostridium ljungdahlii DSM 13528]OAA85814.1 Uric acid transporter UacT [Clostridium ljungdahlii DSM 13528]RMC99498.1 purine permease [Clostridium autoethanogenum]
MEAKRQEEQTSETGLIYGVYDKPKLLSQILLGFQHIFAAFGGIIVVPIIISSSLKLDSHTSTALISAAILVAGIATFIQSRGIGPVGARVACIMGTDITFVAPAVAVGKKFGLSGIFGATILGALIVIILSFSIKYIMKLFPPIVTGIVVCLIGLTLLPISIDWAAGGSGVQNYGSLKNIGIALTVTLITLLLNHYGKGLLSSASILIGMAAGYIICIALGMVDFSSISKASIVTLPKIFEHGITFNSSVLLPFIPAYLVSVISTVGNLRAINEISGIKDDDIIISHGVLSDGLGSVIAGIFGAMPNTSFSQNVGLIPLTKVASKFVTMTAGIILIILGLFPKFAAIINAMPQVVLGGVGIVMFGTVAAAGIQTLSKVKLNNRNLLIIATSIGLGLGVTFRPEILSNLPESLKMIFSSGISTGTIAALILNLILREEK